MADLRTRSRCDFSIQIFQLNPKPGSVTGTQIMVEVYAIHLIPDEEFLQVSAKLMSYLPGPAQARFLRLSRGADVQRSLLGELLARYLLAGRLKIRCNDIIFVVGTNGKPAIPQGSDLHFNISHSGQWAVCAIATVPVGVDVERLRKVNPSLAERFFSPDEVAALRALPEEKQTERFIQLWTLKECFLKAIGRGLTRNLNSFSVHEHQGMYTITGDDSACDYHLRIFPLDKDYMLAACAPATDFCGQVEIIGIDQLHHALAPST